MSDARNISQAPVLLTSALRHFSDLFQSEVALAKAEVTRNVSRAGTGVLFFGIAALLALVALNVLATTLVALLAATGLSVITASLSIGGVFLGTAALLVWAGKSRLSADALAPDRTVSNLKEDIDTLKEAGHGQSG